MYGSLSLLIWEILIILFSVKNIEDLTLLFLF